MVRVTLRSMPGAVNGHGEKTPDFGTMETAECPVAGRFGPTREPRFRSRFNDQGKRRPPGCGIKHVTAGHGHLVIVMAAHHDLSREDDGSSRTHRDLRTQQMVR